MNPLRSTVNRFLLALAGLALLAGGGWLALTASSARSRLPGWWPHAASGSVLIDRPGLETLRAHGWWTPAVLAGTACLLLLSLGWAAAQLRGGGRRLLPLAAAVTLRTRVLAQVVARRTGAAPGVARARVRLPAGRGRLRAGVDLVLEPDAEPAAVLARLAAGPLAEARRSAGSRGMAVQVRMRVRPHRTRRAR